MNEPKLHHYVPRFYLKYFSNTNNNLHVYDKDSVREFEVAPHKVAAKTHFYRLPKQMPKSVDPLILEKNLSKLESKASAIISKILRETSELDAGRKLNISEGERLIFSEFLATQYFRTLELRELMVFLLKEYSLLEEELSADEIKGIQFAILSESVFVAQLGESIYNSIWLFAKNESNNPLITSDHPVCIQSKNNRMWQKGLGRWMRVAISCSL